LLRELGFEVELVSAQVARTDGGFSPDFDHMALLVARDERWLADVGFGDSFIEPLLVDRILWPPLADALPAARSSTVIVPTSPDTPSSPAAR